MAVKILTNCLIFTFDKKDMDEILYQASISI